MINQHTSSQNLQKYRAKIDALRAQRQLPGWEPSLDRALLGELDDLYNQLLGREQDIAEADSYRAWPEPFDSMRRVP